MTGEQKARISAVIPTLFGIKTGLPDALRAQTWPPDEIEIVQGVSPNGRARNLGVARTTGDILVLIDDDALPAQAQLIEKLAEPLLLDCSIGATGASRLLPPGSSWFQRWTARQVPRIENPVVHESREAGPTAANHHYAGITTTCCCLTRKAFDSIGGFDEELIRGVDTEFFIRLSRAGFKLLLMPDLWVHHPAPENMNSLLRKHFCYGFGHAQQVTRELRVARGPEKFPALYIVLRSVALLPHAFFPFSYAEPSWRPGFKPLKALVSYASALGYTWGRISMRRRRRET